MVVLDGLFHGYLEGGDAVTRRGRPGGPGPGLAVEPAVLASVRRRAEAAVRAARAGDLDVLIGYDLRFWRELGDSSATPTSATSSTGSASSAGSSPCPVCAGAPDVRERTVGRAR